MVDLIRKKIVSMFIKTFEFAGEKILTPLEMIEKYLYEKRIRNIIFLNESKFYDLFTKLY